MNRWEPQKPARPAPKPFTPEVRERAVPLVLERHAEYATQCAAIRSIAETIGCSSEAMRVWVRRAERDAGRRPGRTSDERARLATLERENEEPRRANEIRRRASAHLVQLIVAVRCVSSAGC